MRTKVLLLTVGLGVGGTETHILELATRLDRSRFAVAVCSLKSGGEVAKELATRGIRVVALGGRGKWDLRVLFRLLRLVKRERPDVIQAFLFWANIAGRLCARMMKHVRVISSYHDEMVMEGAAVRMCDRLTMRWTNAIVCCSQAVHRSIRACIGGGARPCAIIPFGVDSRRFAPAAPPLARREFGLSDQGMLVGTVCRLVEPKKGLGTLLRAVGRLRGRRMPCQLLIVGDGPARQSLESLCEELGLSSSVRFAGTRRDVDRVLPLLDVFVLPSLYEGFGIAILEAMAAGIPVVATAVGGIPEFIKSGETGVLVEPGNVEALAEAIAGLLADRNRARRMGADARALARREYDIATVVRRHEEVYESCLSPAAQSIIMPAASMSRAGGL